MRAGHPRFIAGATCPCCGALDRVVVEIVAGRLRRRCIDCNDLEYHDESGERVFERQRTRWRERNDDATRPVRVIGPVGGAPAGPAARAGDGGDDPSEHASG